jgi:hypothetical protein
MNPSKLALRGAVVCAALSMFAFASPAAQATTPQGHLDLTPTGCSCTINSVRTGINLVSFLFTNSDPFWAETRLLVEGANGYSGQTGWAVVSHTNIVDGCTTTTDFTNFWRWTSTTDNCSYFNGGDNAYDERLTTGSDKWVLLNNGTIEQTTGKIFFTPSDVLAGGKTSRDDLSTPYVCTNYGASFDQPWQRSANFNDETKTWTTVTNGDNVTRTQEGKWIVGTLPDPFYVEYNPAGRC